jgi:hypothetical protein
MNKHDSLEAALRAPEAPLADDDFSTNVLARLPPPRRRSNVRRWTVAGSAALGSVLTLVFAAPLETVVAAIAPWDISPGMLGAVAAVAIVTIPALLVFYTERQDR